MPEVIDPDDDPLTYNVSQGAGFNPLPSWLRFNQDTRTFTGRQRASHIGEYSVRVAVHDGSLESWANFTLTVVEAPPNQPPIAPSLTDQAAVEEQLFSYVVPEFTDPDGDTLTYAATLADGGSLPAWLTFNPTTRTLSGTPLEPDTPATLTIRVTATDDGEPPASAITDFALAVSERNDAPIAANDTATVAEGGDVSIPASTLLANDSDPEDDALTITAVGSAFNGKGGMDGDVDFLREALRVLVEEIMDAEVSARTGAEYGERSPERVTQRNGYRSRAWDTRV